MNNKIKKRLNKLESTKIQEASEGNANETHTSEESSE